MGEKTNGYEPLARHYKHRLYRIPNAGNPNIPPINFGYMYNSPDLRYDINKARLFFSVEELQDLDFFTESDLDKHDLNARFKIRDIRNDQELRSDITRSMEGRVNVDLSGQINKYEEDGIKKLVDNYRTRVPLLHNLISKSLIMGSQDDIFFHGVSLVNFAYKDILLIVSESHGVGKSASALSCVASGYLFGSNLPRFTVKDDKIYLNPQLNSGEAYMIVYSEELKSFLKLLKSKKNIEDLKIEYGCLEELLNDVPKLTGDKDIESSKFKDARLLKLRTHTEPLDLDKYTVTVISPRPNINLRGAKNTFEDIDKINGVNLLINSYESNVEFLASKLFGEADMTDFDNLYATQFRRKKRELIRKISDKVDNFVVYSIKPTEIPKYLQENIYFDHKPVNESQLQKNLADLFGITSLTDKTQQMAGLTLDYLQKLANIALSQTNSKKV